MSKVDLDSRQSTSRQRKRIFDGMRGPSFELNSHSINLVTLFSQLFQAIDIVEPNSLKATGTLVLGLVKYIHIRKDVLDPVRGVVDPGKLKAVLRLGGITYAKLGDGYQIPRPVWANTVDFIRETLGDDVVSGERKKDDETKRR